MKIGDLSYSIYLLHMLIARLCLQSSYMFLKSSLVVAILAIATSLLLNLLISVPIEKIRQRRLNRIRSTFTSIELTFK